MHCPQNVKYRRIWYAHPVKSAQPPKISIACDEVLCLDFRSTSHQTVKAKQLWDDSQSMETAGITTYYVILYKESIWSRSFETASVILLVSKFPAFQGVRNAKAVNLRKPH
jgi:hypothetical protein